MKSEGEGLIADPEIQLEELEPEEIKILVEKSLKGLRFHSPDVALREWVVDTWKSCGKWPFSHPLTKCLGKLTDGCNTFRLASFIARSIPLGHKELAAFGRIFRLLSARKGCFRNLFLKIKKEEILLRSSDLYPIFYRRQPSPRFIGWKYARWRRVAAGVIKPLLQKSSGINPLFSPHSFFTAEYWDGYGNLSFKWLDRLIESQAEELCFIRDFCHEVSRKSRKVVLSWHNATLGAIGGWAFSVPILVLSDKPDALASSKARLHKRCEKDEALSRGWELFESRIIVPALRFYLWLEKQCGKIAMDEAGPVTRYLKELCLRYPEWRRVEISISCDKSASSYVFPPVSGSPERGLRFLNWCEQQRKLWERGWVMQDRLIEIGFELLRSGEIASFVLPRIDKFFISTRRTADVEYLAILVNRLVRKHQDKVLILLWDDTIHSGYPSLYLAIDKLLRLGVPLCGLGIFANGKVGDNPEPGYIVEKSKDYRLFILRPYERPFYGSFSELFRKRDYSFFHNYSPTWRDGLSFIYSGTAVENFVSLPVLMEEHAPWIVAGGKKVPFGVWFRAILRRRVNVPDVPLERSDDLPWVEKHYAQWANML